MLIPEDFLKSEVRDGFYVPSFMKRSWAATLVILNEIAVICERHNLTWWIDWGSLIATVRHHGFIPWDDDMDISMFRKDYSLFEKYAAEELPEGYFINNIHTNPRFDEYHTRVLNSTYLKEDEEFLNHAQGFPYTAGVDIFCIDYVNPNEKVDEEICKTIYNVGSIATHLDPGLYRKDIPQYKSVLKDIEALCRYRFNDREPVRQQINKLCESLMQGTPEEEAKKATCMVNHATRKGFRGVFPKEYYEELIVLPYEFIEVPAPLHYDEILKTLFGNYMRPYRAGGVHEYPYYDQQEAMLKGKELPLRREEYKYQGEKPCLN